MQVLLGRGILAGLLALAMVTCLAVSDGAQQKLKTLYERLGGYDAIAAVTDDFIGPLVADKQITRFFTGASTDSKKRIRQLVVDQICAATGGPCIYIGRSMKVAHEGLGISESDWQSGIWSPRSTSSRCHRKRRTSSWPPSRASNPTSWPQP